MRGGESALSVWDKHILYSALVMGLASALAARLYLALHDGVQLGLKRIEAIWRPAIGGLIVIALVLISGERSYLGLGLRLRTQAVTITGSFAAGNTGHDSWLWKTIYTAITLGSGFKGGEVTPLFFIGATLGNSLATIAGPSIAVCAWAWTYCCRQPRPCLCGDGRRTFGWNPPLT